MCDSDWLNQLITHRYKFCTASFFNFETDCLEEVKLFFNLKLKIKILIFDYVWD